MKKTGHHHSNPASPNAGAQYQPPQALPNYLAKYSGSRNFEIVKTAAGLYVGVNKILRVESKLGHLITPPYGARGLQCTDFLTLITENTKKDLKTNFTRDKVFAALNDLGFVPPMSSGYFAEFGRAKEVGATE